MESPNATEIILSRLSGFMALPFHTRPVQSIISRKSGSLEERSKSRANHAIDYHFNNLY